MISLVILMIKAINWERPSKFRIDRSMNLNRVKSAESMHITLERMRYFERKRNQNYYVHIIQLRCQIFNREQSQGQNSWETVFSANKIHYGEGLWKLEHCTITDIIQYSCAIFVKSTQAHFILTSIIVSETNKIARIRL